MRVRILPGAPEKTMKIYKPFGPTIGKTKLSSRTVTNLNKFSDQVSKNKSLSKKYDYDHRLIGSMKQQFKIPNKILKAGIEKQIINSIKDYYKQTLNIKVKKIKIERAWIVSQYAGDFNPPHLHRGNISGVCASDELFHVAESIGLSVGVDQFGIDNRLLDLSAGHL